MTVEKARDAVSYCHPRMPEMLANFEAAVRANERAKADERWSERMEEVVNDWKSIRTVSTDQRSIVNARMVTLDKAIRELTTAITAANESK